MESKCLDCIELNRQLKLVQNHCSKQWNQGYQLRGMHDMYLLLEAQREITKLRKQLADDNAYFTEEIMRLEECVEYEH